MVKKLFEVYVTYGKGDGEELQESWVAEDTPEERLKALGDVCGWADDWDAGTSDFEDGKIDSIGFITQGDWDDPTGGWLQVESYDDKRTEIIKQYHDAINMLKKMFKLVEEADENV